MSEPFLIKHLSSGKFFHVHSAKDIPPNQTGVVLHSDIHHRMQWRFIKVDKYWGYIEQVCSGKIIHPLGGDLKPENETQLVVHSDRQFAALFALDGQKEHVIHKGGRYAHPSGARGNPPNDTNVVLHSDTHDAMRFQFVSPQYPHKEILVYGSPNAIGKWEIINAVINPGAEHKSTVTVKVGKTKTETKKSTFEYKWESSLGVVIKEIFSASVNQSVRSMIEKTSSETWTEETIKTREITVSPGQTVVTWQFKFLVEQDESRAIFQSNLLADTDSEITEPRDFQYVA